MTLHKDAGRAEDDSSYQKSCERGLGHSNISTTLNLYVHPNMEQKRHCIDQMCKMLR